MHIILGLLGAIGFIAMIIWRISVVARASHDIIDAADSARGFYRRAKWRGKTNADQLKQIDDPREAAVVMMVAVAEYDGSVSDRERNAIIGIIVRDFEASVEVAEEFFARARWMTKNAGDLTTFLNRLKPVVQAKCSDEQKAELIGMLIAVAQADGTDNSGAMDSIGRLKYNLGV